MNNQFVKTFYFPEDLKLYMIKEIEYSPNIYLIVSKNEAILIDTGLKTYFNFYKAVIEKILKKEKLNKIKIINTHEHFDHISSNKNFLQFFKSKGIKSSLILHESTAKIIKNKEEDKILTKLFNQKLNYFEINKIIKEGDLVEIPGFELKIIHTPGHSEGSISLYNDLNKILFTGDLIFKYSWGRTDFPGSDKNKLIISLKKLINLNICKAFPGHGELIDDWENNLNFVLESLKNY